MHNAIVIGGRLVGPRNVQLDEPVMDLRAQIEVIVRCDQRQKSNEQNLTEFLGGLPAGTRSRKDIDELLRSERVGWERSQ